QITKSIHSARITQQALLPFDEQISKLFSDYFVIFRPKEIVSGDFYWIEQVEDTTFVIAADCTGHGIPGAFMSMIGTALLDRIIMVNKIFDPAEILVHLNQGIQKALKQKDTSNSNGMEVGVVTLKKLPKGKTRMVFAGAKNTMYYVQPGSHEVVKIKGDRQAIGGFFVRDHTFRNHEIVLEPAAQIYMGSDGLVDQNDIHRKKFSPKNLDVLLSRYACLPLSDQKTQLEKALNKHMEGAMQRDDILWLGIKL
ncbi:MAG: SpoIIE family protein phosphatase, partial [Bacteroidia bacterium]|nr:SpoIIE family protein phosphatase [Bacteroidia bacterium]